MASSEEYQRKKGETHVLLLGPYGDCKNDLLEMKKFVIEKGYTNCFIVEELPELEHLPKEPEDAYFFEKSCDYIENWGEIIIFHFPTECDCKSVLRELGFLCDRVPQKRRFSTIIRNEKYDLGTLFGGNIRVRRIMDLQYSCRDQICDMAFSACFYTIDDVLLD